MAKILIIDDDQYLREATKLILQDENYETVEASGGNEGVEKALKHLPDIVLCDIIMDDMDGYAVLDEFQQNAAISHIPFIFMTGQTSRESMRRGMSLGADDYLTKPFTAGELLSSIKARLSKQDKLHQQIDQKMQRLRINISLALPHELRTPLNAVIGLSNIIERKVGAMDNDKIRELALGIHTAGNRLYRTVENILTYARIELFALDHGKIKLLHQTFTRDATNWVKALAGKKAEETGRSEDLLLDVSDGIPAIHSTYFAKILNELLDNCFKFSQPGTSVNVGVKISDDQYILSIADSGRGMTAEQIEAIGAYMQFERRVYEQQGTGLGLIIAKRLVELHRGSLTITSEPNVGTTVTVSFPLRTDK